MSAPGQDQGDGTTAMPDFVMPERESATPRRTVPGAGALQGVRARAGAVGAALGRPWRGVRRALRRPLVALVAGVVTGGIVVGAGTATIGTLDDAAPTTLDALVDAYLNAVAAGDAAAANAFAMPDADEGSTALLTDEVLAAAEPMPLECAEPDVAGDSATVTCPMEAWGTALEVTLAHDADGWRIEQGLAQLVRMESTSIPVDRVGGVALPEEVADGTQPLWLYPGTYEATVESATDPDVPLAGYAYALGEGSSFMGASMTPTLAIEQEAAQLVEHHLAACASGPGTDVVCADVEPVQGDTVWSATSLGMVWRSSPVQDPTVLHLGVLARRGGDALAGAAHRVIVRVELTPALDGHELSIEQEPEGFLWP